MRNPVVAYQEIGFYEGPDGLEARSLLPSGVISLVAHGADGILVPAMENNQVIEAAKGALAPELAKRVKIVDSNMSTLRRIERFIEPISEAVRELDELSNEAHLARILPTCLYPMALAEKHSGVASESRLGSLLHLFHSIDLASFDDEARFRLAQISSLLTSYGPKVAHGPLLHRLPEHGFKASTLVDLVTCSEYDQLVAESGALSFAKDPTTVLRRIRVAVANLLERPASKPLLKGVESALLLSGSSIPSEALASIASIAAKKGRLGPPVMAVSSLERSRYLATLASLGAGYSIPDGQVEHWHVHEPGVCGSRHFPKESLMGDGFQPADYEFWDGCSGSTVEHFQSLGHGGLPN